MWERRRRNRIGFAEYAGTDTSRTRDLFRRVEAIAGDEDHGYLIAQMERPPEDVKIEPPRLSLTSREATRCDRKTAQ
jgi:hypothetical protein